MTKSDWRIISGKLAGFDGNVTEVAAIVTVNSLSSDPPEISGSTKLKRAKKGTIRAPLSHQPVPQQAASHTGLFELKNARDLIASQI
jgi:hypothetical protein